MGLSSAFGTLSILSTDTATSTKVVSGLSFAPQVVFLMWSGHASGTDGIEGATIHGGFGVAFSTSARHAVGQINTDGANPTVNRYANHNAACVVTVDAAGFTGLLDIQSFDSGGITFVIDDQFPIDLRVHYLMLGGGDITNTALGEFQLNTALGDQDITSVGFQPDIVACYQLVRQSATAPPNEGAEGGWHIGWFDGTDQFEALAASLDAAATTQTLKYARDGSFISKSNAGITSLNIRATAVQMLSNGFRINLAEVSATAAQVFYLAIKGGKWKVGNSLTRTDGNDIALSSFGFAPVAALVFSCAAAEHAADTPTDEKRFSQGMAASPTSRGAVAWRDQDNVSPSNTERAIEYDEIYIATDAAAALEGLMDLKSFDSDGMTFVMDDTDPAANWFGWVAVGPTATPYTPLPHEGTAPWSSIWRSVRF